MRFARETYEATLGTDLQNVERGVASAQAEARDFARETYEATLGANGSEFARDVAGVVALGQDFERERFDATVGADTTPARRTLSGFDEVFRRYARSWGQQGIRARVQADIQRAQTSLRILEGQLDSVTDPVRRVRVEAEITRTRERLQALGDVADQLGVKRSTITVGLRGFLATQAQMLGLQRLADRLDGYNVRFRADIDRSLSDALPNILGALEQQLVRNRVLMTAFAAVTVPVFQASLAAIPFVASAAAGAVGSLAISVGQGLVGAFGAVGGAAGLAAGAVTAYGAALNRTINYVGDFTNTLYSQITAVDHSNDVLAAAKQNLQKVAMESGKYANAQDRLTKIEKGAQKALEAAKEEVEGARDALKEATPGTREYARAREELRRAEDRLAGLQRSSNEEIRAAEKVLKAATPRTREYMLAQRGVALAQENARYEQERLNAMLGIATPRILKLNRSLNDARIGFLKFGGQIMNAVAPGISLALKRWEEFAPAVQQGAIDMAREMDGVTQRFIELATTGQSLRSIQTILKGIKDAGVPALRLLGDAALLFLNVLSPIVPTSLKVLGSLSKLVREARVWSGTADGQREIGRVWAYLFGQGQKLYRIGVNLAEALWGVGMALEASGTGNWLLGEIEKLTGTFARNLAAGGEWRAGIQRFMEDLRPVLRAVGPLVAEVAKGFVSLVNTVMNTRQPNGQRTIIAIIEDAVPVVRELVDLLRHEFKAIAPLLPGIIEDMGEWFNTFARATPEMRAFIRIFGRVLDLFTDLPKEQQVAIARTLAYVSAFKALGGGAVLSALAGLTATVVQWRLLSNIWRNMPKQPAAPVPGVPGGPVTVATAPATGGAAKRTWTSRLGALIRGLALPAILVTVVATYNREASNKAYEEAREHGQTRGLSVFQGFVEGMKSVPILGDFFTWFDTTFDEKLGKKGRYKKFGGTFAANLVSGIFEGLKTFPIVGPIMAPILDGILKWWGIKSPSTKAAKRIGRPIALGILEGFRNAPLIGPIIRVLQRLFGRSKEEVDGQGWKGLGGGAAGAVLRGFLTGGLIGGAIALIRNWFRRSKGEKDKQNWKPLGSSAIKAVTEGFVTGGLIGGAVALIRNWFRRSKEEKNAQNWKPLGSSATKSIVDGFRTGGLIGAAIALVRSWYEKTKEERDGQKWYGIGKDSILGIIRGLKNTSPLLMRVMSAIAKLMPDWAKKALGISSPSKVMAGIGKNVAEGFAKGIDDNARLARDAAQRMAKGSAANLMEAFSAARPSFGSISASLDSAAARGVLSSQAAAGARREARLATSASSPGGRAITADEMRGIMQELPDRMLAAVRAAAAMANGSPEFMRYLDSQMGGYFDHRNSMRADAR